MLGKNNPKIEGYKNDQLILMGRQRKTFSMEQEKL